MLTEFLKQAGSQLIDLVYPPVCLVCGAEREAGCLCDGCIRDFCPVLPPFCDRCGVPVAADQIVCVSCAMSAPPFSWTHALAHYDGKLLHAIHRLKYHRKTALARPLGTLLARSLDSIPLLHEHTPAFDCVVPVPLYWSRLQKRGFNQSELLAEVIAEERGWRLDTATLKRTRFTRTQASLTERSERLANILGAFETSTPLAFQGQSVLLVDDVLTTLGTVRECARVLRNAGAKRVCVAALARG